MNVKFNWTEVVRFKCSLESLWPWISVFGFIINLPVSVHIPEGYACELDHPLTSWFSVIQEKIWESKCVQMQMRFPHTKKTTVFNLSSACTCILSVKFKYRNIVRNTCKTVFKKLFFTATSVSTRLQHDALKGHEIIFRGCVMITGKRKKKILSTN